MIDVNELKKMIDAKVEADNVVAEKAAQAKEQHDLKLMNEIRQLAPRIKSLLDLRIYAEDAGIELKFDRSYDRRDRTFYTDGFYHKTGFVECDKHVMGIDAGGACGDTDFRVAPNGLCYGTPHDGQMEIRKPLTKHMEQFLKDFPLFEIRLEKYIKQFCERK